MIEVSLIIANFCALAAGLCYRAKYRLAKQDLEHSREHADWYSAEYNRQRDEIIAQEKQVAACHARVKYIEAKWNADHSGAELSLSLFGPSRIDCTVTPKKHP